MSTTIHYSDRLVFHITLSKCRCYIQGADASLISLDSILTATILIISTIALEHDTGLDHTPSKFIAVVPVMSECMLLKLWQSVASHWACQLSCSTYTGYCMPPGSVHTKEA